MTPCRVGVYEDNPNKFRTRVERANRGSALKLKDYKLGEYTYS